MDTEFKKELREIVGESNFLENEMMDRHTTFKIGGPCDCLIKPSDVNVLSKAVALCVNNDIPFFVIGRGSNLLVDDDGVRGVVIIPSGEMTDISLNGNELTAGAGASLINTAAFAVDHGLAGLEFAGGIPGSVGGGLVMNAGAYGGEMKDVVKCATILCNGRLSTLSKEELNLSYRHSVIEELDHAIVVSVTFDLKPGDSAELKAKISELNRRRMEKQPFDYPSAGSTFKRPVGGYASALIEQAGLKGLAVGGAQVSEKHAGFIINRENATYHDVIALIKLVEDKVEQRSGIRLEPEVKILGK